MVDDMMYKLWYVPNSNVLRMDGSYRTDWFFISCNEFKTGFDYRMETLFNSDFPHTFKIDDNVELISEASTLEELKYSVPWLFV